MQGWDSDYLNHFRWDIMGIFSCFKGSKRKKRRKDLKLVEHPEKIGSKPLNRSNDTRKDAEYTIKASVHPSSPQNRKASHQDPVLKVVVAPWSFSAAEVKERLERARRHSRAWIDDERLLVGDVEGMWQSCKDVAWMKYLPTHKEEERLNGLFNNDAKYAQATQLNAILGRGRYRCKCSMGAKRWNSFVQREQGYVKEHISMLKEHWGRHFYDRCSKFVSFESDTTNKDVRRVTSNTAAAPHKMRVLNVGFGIDTLKHQSHNEGLRAKHAKESPQIGIMRPKTANEQVYDACDYNDGDFRIGVRPFSS